MKKLLTLSLFTIFLFSCKNDDGRSCTQCQSDETPPFELCQESDGTASVNGQNTGTDYDTYLADLEDTGVSCGN